MSLRKNIIQSLKFTGFLAAGAVLLWLAFRSINTDRLLSSLAGARYGWIILSIVFAFMAYVSRARRWVLLIEPLGFKPSLRNTFHAMMTGYLANMALPRVGEITRCIALGRKEKIPADQLIGTVVIERGIDIFSLLLITLFMLIVDGKTLGPFLNENVILPVQEKMINLFGFPWMIWVLITGFFLLTAALIYILRRGLRRIRFFSKLFDAARGVLTGLGTFTRVKRKKEFVFHTIFIWLNYALMTWVVVFSLRSTSHLDLADGMFLLVIGGLAMSAPVQSGLGAFHFIVSRGLNAVYGISLEDGLAYALLAHESQLLFGMILGFVAFFSLVRKDKIKLTAGAEE